MKIQTAHELKGSPRYNKPHVVILGAGASKAAFPDGDRNGRLVPIMQELPSILGRDWHNLLEDAKPPSDGFEGQFAWLRRHSTYTDRLQDIEGILFDYFATLALPDVPTIYDYLLLGLQQKDMVATFNWDPFLMLAHRRNRGIPGLSLPDIRFLHGCVIYASCVTHTTVLGSPGEYCPTCKRELTASKLVLPVEDKEYGRDPLIANDWHVTSTRLKSAFHLTIFGYSGPKTDHNAKRLLHDGWSPPPEIAHVEIIDVVSETVLYDNWDDFLPFGHLMTPEDFFDSTIAKWPRRTAEYKLAASLYGTPSEPMGPYLTDSLAELQEYHAEIARAESERRKS